MKLCALAEIEEPGAKGPLTVQIGGEDKRIFLIRFDGQIRGYVDSCPHVFVPLEMDEDMFMDSGRVHILCSLHGARFDPLTGDCLWGPCQGRRLQNVAVSVQGDAVWLD